MKIRVRFSKNENIKFLGHLDIMRAFQKCMNRANIKMVYSEGFNPHQKMSFALPLGVGCTSRAEYMDAEVADGQEPDEIFRRLTAVSGPGFDIINVKRLKDDAKKAMAAVEYAGFAVKTTDHSFSDAEILSLLDESSITVVKKTKKSEKEIDIRPLIRYIRLEDGIIHMMLKAGSNDNIKPDIVMDRLYDRAGLAFDRNNIEICREELYGEGDIPLDELGTE